MSSGWDAHWSAEHAGQEHTPVTEYAITVTGGKAVSEDTDEISKAAKGAEVTLTADAAPDGKVFDKWEVVSGSVTLADATSEITTFTMPAGAVSVRASYKEAPSYYCFLDTGRSPYGKIKFDDLSQEESSTMRGFFPAGKEVTAIAYPDDGYRFKEWQNRDGNVVSEKNPYSFNLNGESWLYAIFEAKAAETPENYTVSFYPNGGTGLMTDVTVVSGSYTLPSNGFTAPAGKQFKGWAESAGGTVISGSTINVTGDITLYAVWEDVPVTEYTVTFDAKGHGTAPATETVEDGGMATMPSSLTESGWIFGGWYTDAGCTNAFDFTTPITGSITLFAKWTKNSEVESGSGGSSSSGGGSSSSGGGSSSSGGGSSSSGGGSSSGGSYRKVSGMRNQYTGTWRKDSGGWWYHHSGSYPKNEWKFLPWDGTGAWYFFDEAGYMKTGWHLSNGKWYYLGEVSDGTLGAMKTGWVLDPNDAHWYYLNPGDGAMRTGWLEAGGRWYYLNEGKTRPLGAMYRNEKTPDGYIVDDSGAWKR